MASNDEDKILINVGLNTSEAEQGITALGKKIESVSNQNLGTTNVQSYKLQIRELTAELQKIEQVQGRNSQAFRDGAKELGRLKLAALDFKQSIEAANPALGRFGSLIPIARGAAVAMTGVAGAMGLFGIKGAKAEEVMLRLQSVLALSHALSGIHEITNGYRSFVSMLGLTSAAAAKVVVATDAQVVSSEAVTESLTAQQVAEDKLAVAKIAAAEATIEAETALNAVKAEGLDATVATTVGEQAFLETAAAKVTALQALTAAQAEYDAALAAGTEGSAAASEANIAQVATTEAVTVAEEGATGASIGLKAALWSIGIGLIITALAYLVSNWDKVTAAVERLFPALKNTGTVFKEFSQIISGVGLSVIKFLKIPIDEVVTGIKVLIDVLKGDFKAAAADFKDGLKQIADDANVIANFKEGAAEKAASQAEDERKIRVQKEVDANERIIKERKALGQDTYALEIKNQQLKNTLLDKDADDYQKKLADGESEITVLQNTEIKKRADEAEKVKKAAKQKADALRKADLDKLKSGEDEAAKVLNEGRRSQRDIELADADFKYNKLIAIAKKYGKDASDLEEALGITKSRINKKYADEVKAYLEKSDDDTLNEFEKKRKQILKEADAVLKNANPDESEAINASRDYQLNRSYKEEGLSNATSAANVGVTNTENANRAGADGKDSAQTVFNKEEAIRKAKLAALKAQYAQEQFLAAGNATKLAEIEANYQKASKDSDDEGAKARIALAEAEKEAKLATYDEVSQGLQAAADIAGKNTVAGKALAVASATISTYLSAQKAYESQFLPVPDLTSPVRGALAAGVAVASGLANIKTILSVKVPGASSSAGVTPSYSAPTINSTVLNAAQQGIQNVNVLNHPDTTKQQPIKAYVVEKDISSAQDRAAYLDRQSTI
ncbi:hypothetical protein [Mucilaginibacter sp.]|uniref:hypothetical protein n=1 Tax=Mucilaginibacter sp. TaxID=1882438 RepID=UPI003D09B86E